MKSLPVFFLSHGGGPWPFMHGPMRANYNALEGGLHELVQKLPRRPKAILVSSGHWEERNWRISSSASPGMVFDYYGFPEYTYHISYPAPGSPELACRVRELLAASGIGASLDDERGYDHGTFSVLKAMYAQADIPVVQVSLKTSLDADEHLALGQALEPLRSEDVLIIGSGFSFHNLRLFGPAGQAPSRAFDAWLRQTLLGKTASERRAALAHWENAPAARLAHPREEHLMPLMVAAGAAGVDAATCVYSQSDFMGFLQVSSYGFGCSSQGA